MDPRDPFRDGLPTLDGGRVRLRPLEARDAAALVALYGDPQVRRFGYAPPMAGEADALALVELCRRLCAERAVFHWGVADAATDEVIGHATLFHLAAEHRRAEVGYSVRRELWGRGLGTLSVSVLLRFAFEVLDLFRIEADVDPRNVGSLRVLEKHGFVREGYLRQRWRQEGEVQDGVFLGLLRPEWRAPRG